LQAVAPEAEQLKLKIANRIRFIARSGLQAKNPFTGELRPLTDEIILNPFTGEIIED